MNRCEHGHKTDQETRILPLNHVEGRGSENSLILCQAHYAQEVTYYRQGDGPIWSDLEVHRFRRPWVLSLAGTKWGVKLVWLLILLWIVATYLY